MTLTRFCFDCNFVNNLTSTIQLTHLWFCLISILAKIKATLYDLKWKLIADYALNNQSKTNRIKQPISAIF